MLEQHKNYFIFSFFLNQYIMSGKDTCVLGWQDTFRCCFVCSIKWLAFAASRLQYIVRNHCIPAIRRHQSHMRVLIFYFYTFWEANSCYEFVRNINHSPYLDLRWLIFFKHFTLRGFQFVLISANKQRSYMIRIR